MAQRAWEGFWIGPRPFEPEHLPDLSQGQPGVYLLLRREDNNPPIFVGRADTDLRAALADHMARWTEPNTWFVFGVTVTPEEAFDRQCDLWHGSEHLQYEQEHPEGVGARACRTGCLPK